MSKRRSKELTFFCLPEELQAILTPMLARTGGRLCTATERKAGHYQFKDVFFPEALNVINPQSYICFSTMLATEDFASLVGIVQVWFPVLRGERLRMGRVAMLVAESELTTDLRETQEEFFREIRKALTKRFRRGVLGRNSKTGGEHFYNDILISERAARAYADGTVLATLMGDGFVTFHVERA